MHELSNSMGTMGGMVLLTNLPKDIRVCDLEELCREYGEIYPVSLAKVCVTLFSDADIPLADNTIFLFLTLGK